MSAFGIDTASAITVDRPSASVRRLSTATGLVLLDTSADCLWAYNDTARQVWDRVEQCCSGDDLAADLARQYSIPTEIARRDVGAIMSEWLSRGLLSDGRDRPSARTHANAETDWTRIPQPRWAATFTFTIKGKVFAVAVETAELASLIRLSFRHLEVPGTHPDVRLEIRQAGSGEHAILVDGIERLRTATGGVIVGAVDQIVLEHLNPEIEWLALVHGGAVARSGAGFAVPGQCRSGKTTLIAHLVAEKGYSYVADDMIALAAPDGRIVPCPMPLNPKEGSWDLLAKSYPGLPNAPNQRMGTNIIRQIIPDTSAWDTAPVPLHGFIFPRYVADTKPTLTRLTPFEALERLLSDQIWLGYPLTEQRVQSFLAWLEDRPAYALVHGDVVVAADLLDDME